jgi:hypothetical protein
MGSRSSAGIRTRGGLPLDDGATAGRGRGGRSGALAHEVGDHAERAPPWGQEEVGRGAAQVRESAWQETRSEFEGAPRVVEAVWVGEADVAAGGPVLGVAALHPHDGLGDAGLGGHREAAHAAGGPCEGGRADANVAKGRDDHRGDKGHRWDRVAVGRPSAVGPAGEFREQGRAYRAPGAGPGELGADGAWAGARLVHEGMMKRPS